MNKKRIITIIIVVFMILSMIFGAVITGYASNYNDLNNQKEELQSDLASLQNSINDLKYKIAENSSLIEKEQAKVEEINNEYQALLDKQNALYSSMKSRIKYMYEIGYSSFIETILSAKNLSDMISKAEYVESISKYDREQMNKLKVVVDKIADNRRVMNEKLDKLISVKSMLNSEYRDIRYKATLISNDIDYIDSLISSINNTNTSTYTSSDSTEVHNKPSDYNYYSPGSGILNPVDGVIFYNGHKETYYSQRVLPGLGLNIPGRHVEADGTVRDAEGFICLASMDYPKGTVIQVSLGMGKVYDYCEISGVIDVYTDW